jgi:hypothetical protein
MADLANWILGALAVGGFLVLFATYFSDRLLEQLHQQQRLKFFVEGMVFASGVPVVGRSFAADSASREPWYWSSVWGILGVLMWRWVAIRSEHKAQQSIKKFDQVRSEKDREIETFRTKAQVAEREATLRTKLNVYLRKLVEQKRQQVCGVLRNRGFKKGTSIRTAEDCLEPKKHMDHVLRAMLLFLREQLPDSEESTHRKFRAAFYREDDNGQMVLYHGVGDDNRTENPHTSYRTHADHFRVNNTSSPSVVVVCAREQRLVVVSDCLVATEQGSFAFFRPEQRTYLCSVAAFPVTEAIDKDGKLRTSVLVVDTDVPGFFSGEQCSLTKTCMSAFAARLSLEMALLALVTRR